MDPEREHVSTQHDPGFLTVSNLLSLSRIPLGIVFLVTDRPVVLASVAVLGAGTDLLDGFIARRSDTQSEVGALLDPFCDKVFVLMGLLSFLPGGSLDWAAFVVLILRDIFTGGSYLLGRILGRVIPFRSRLGGKVTTALQVLTLLSLLFWQRGVPLFVLLVGVAAVYAIIDYGMVGIRNVQRQRAA